MPKLTQNKITDNLAIALFDLLEDSQHKKHKCCTPTLCPVKRAQKALDKYNKFMEDKCKK
jgi:hypothetical protein